MITQSPSKSWFLIGVGLLAPMIAARAARSLAGAGYQAITHEEPPKNPAHPEVALKEAVAWAVIAGAVGGLARMGAGRALAHTEVPAEGYDMDPALEE
ncbi:DUF4235 domain-containing protein [Verrucomicrobiaceae bacterium 227]